MKLLSDELKRRFCFDKTRNPRHFLYTLDLPGLVPSKWWCATIYGGIHALAERLCGENYGLAVSRDAVTGEKTGYQFGADSLSVVDEVRLAFQHAVHRAQQVRL